jgi:hypothetical protein
VGFVVDKVALTLAFVLGDLFIDHYACKVSIISFYMTHVT